MTISYQKNHENLFNDIKRNFICFDFLSVADKGELVLLSKVFHAIKSPFDMLAGDIKFKHWHRVADIHRSKANGWLDDIHFKNGRAPIVHLGYRKFTQSNFEGEEVGFEALGPGDLLQHKKYKLRYKLLKYILRKFG